MTDTALTVTTFDTEKHWESHARRMVRSVLANWPTPLRVYASPVPAPFDRVPDATPLSWHEPERMVIPQPPYFVEGWEHDVYRFVWKVFAILDAAETTDARYLFWLDADTYVHRAPTMDDLKGLFCGKAYCYLGREGGYPETGFLGFDLQHDWAGWVLGHARETYRSGQVYALDGWTDIHVFGDVFEDCEHVGHNLSPTARDTDHALTMSPLAMWLDHMKGPRKAQGFSPEHPEAERLKAEAGP